MGEVLKNVFVWKLGRSYHPLRFRILPHNDSGKKLCHVNGAQQPFSFMVKIPKLFANASLDLSAYETCILISGISCCSFSLQKLFYLAPQNILSLPRCSYVVLRVPKVAYFACFKKNGCGRGKKTQPYSIFRKTVNISSFLTKHTLFTP